MVPRLRTCMAALLAVPAVLLCLAAPADARWASSTPVRSLAFTTGTVAPPTGVSAVLGSCSNGRWMSVTVAWTASGTAGVSGYAVNAHRSDGSTVNVAQTAAGTTSVNTTVDKLSSGSTTVTFTVITQTSYGWTAESSPSGPLTC